jgi:hypothetical protein
MLIFIVYVKPTKKIENNFGENRSIVVVLNQNIGLFAITGKCSS